VCNGCYRRFTKSDKLILEDAGRDDKLPKKVLNGFTIWNKDCSSFGRTLITETTDEPAGSIKKKYYEVYQINPDMDVFMPLTNEVIPGSHLIKIDQFSTAKGARCFVTADHYIIYEIDPNEQMNNRSIVESSLWGKIHQ
jgi:hypothetical protein